MTFNPKYELGQLVEYDPPVASEQGFAYGFVYAIRFRKTDSVNVLAEYTIQRCNEERFDTDVRETEIKASFNRVSV